MRCIVAFKPGVSGNPSGRPKKLLKRIDEVLHARGIEPIELVLAELDRLKRIRGKEAKTARATRIKLLMELMPYVYARPKELPEIPDPLGSVPTPELARQLLAMIPELQKIAGEVPRDGADPH